MNGVTAPLARIAVIAGVVLSLGVAAAGCGSSSGGSASSAGASSGGSTSRSQAKALLGKYRAMPTFAAPGAAFDAKAKAHGKTLFVIPASSQIPFVSTIANNMKSIGGTVGVQVSIWQNQGQPSEWVQGMDAATSQNASAIVLLAGIDPASLEPQIQAAKAKGIPTIVAHLYGEQQQQAPNLGGVVNIPYELAGQLIAGQAISDSHSTDALAITINQVKSTVPMVAGIKSQFAAFCSGCKLNSTDVTLADIATKIQPNVQSALTADPALNYVLALYDSAEVPFAEAAIRAAGRTGSVKIATFNGTPEILKQVGKGTVSMDVAENLNWIAYATVDQSMRIMGHLPPVADEHIPVRVFDQSNIANAGSDYTSGFGTSYISGYKKLWGLQ